MLSLVPTPIGNIGDVSLRAIETLGGADVILCEDTRVTKKLIHILKQRYNATFKEMQKFIPIHSHNEQSFVENLESTFVEQNVVYVSDAGMAGVSDPGQLLVRYCIDNNLPYDVLPGANAVLTAFVASGYMDTKMLFWGFLPHKGKERRASLEGALGSGYTTVLYESPHRLKKLLLELEELVGNREIFLAKELSKKYQRYIHATPSKALEMLQGEIRGEWVVVLQAGQSDNPSAVSQKDILALDIPLKSKAKLISKITGENTKSCYARLLQLTTV